MLPADKYFKLNSQCLEISKSLTLKLSKAVEARIDENLQEDSLQFFYYNKTNLAVMHSSSVYRQSLSLEVKHYMNLVKEKFESNAGLSEY